MPPPRTSRPRSHFEAIPIHVARLVVVSPAMGYLEIPWRVTVANMHSTTGKIKLLCAVDGCQPVRATSTPRVCWGLGGSLPDAEPGAAQRAADSTWLGNGRAAVYYSLVE